MSVMVTGSAGKWYVYHTVDLYQRVTHGRPHAWQHSVIVPAHLVQLLMPRDPVEGQQLVCLRTLGVPLSQGIP